MNQDTPYTVRECARHLGIHPKTVTRLARQRKLPFARVGKRMRFFCHELDTYIKTGRTAI